MSEWRKALEAKFPYHRPELGPNCVYCGNDAHRGRDHVPPLCVVSRFPASCARVLYPCCPRCNLALMDYPETCLMARVWVIILSLMEPHQDPETPDEIKAFLAASDEAERIYNRIGTRRFYCMCPSCRPCLRSELPVTWEPLEGSLDFQPCARSGWVARRCDTMPSLSEIDAELLENGFSGEGIKREFQADKTRKNGRCS